MRLLMVLFLVVAIPNVSLALGYQGQCMVEFYATSTLHDFEGKGVCEPFTVDEKDGILSVPELHVAVSSMDTDNDKRDKKMLEMFQEPLYQLITGSTGPVILEDIRNSLKEDSAAAGEVIFDLKIRETVQTVTARLENIREKDKTLAADLVFSVSLEDYQLEPPSVLGFIRVGDQVDVKVSFFLGVQ